VYFFSHEVVVVKHNSFSSYTTIYRSRQAGKSSRIDMTIEACV
jgi:hypothetical protein